MPLLTILIVCLMVLLVHHKLYARLNGLWAPHFTHSCPAFRLVQVLLFSTNLKQFVSRK